MLEKRRFTLFDIAILIAATAIGLASMRYLSFLSSYRSAALSGVSSSEPRFAGSVFHRRFSEGIVIAVPFLLAYEAATIVLIMAQSKGSWRSAARRRGFIIAIAASVGASAHAIDIIMTNIKFHTMPGSFNTALYMPGVAERAGLAVIAAGIATAGIRTRRIDRSWVDRFGLVVGAAWPIIYILIRLPL